MSGIRCPMCDYDVDDCNCDDRYGVREPNRYEKTDRVKVLHNGSHKTVVGVWVDKKDRPVWFDVEVERDRFQFFNGKKLPLGKQITTGSVAAAEIDWPQVTA